MPIADDRLDNALDKLPLKLREAYDKLPFRRLHEINTLFNFLITKNSKDIFLQDPEKQENDYYSFIKKIWGLFATKEIDTPKLGNKTILMNVLGHTRDSKIILFAIENTSSKGVSARCPSEVIGEEYALAEACAQELHECLEPLIAKSTGDSLKAGMDYLEVVYRSKTFRSLTFNGDGSIGKSYTLDEISHLMKLIKERQAQLQWGIVPVIGPLVRGLLYPKTIKTEAAPAKASSLKSPKQTGTTNAVFTDVAVSPSAQIKS